MTQEVPSNPSHIPSLNSSFILLFFFKNKYWHKIMYFFSTNTLTAIIVVLCQEPLLQEELVYGVCCSD